MATEVKQPWVQALLDWYYANGRELPWRGVGDPYHIWVSEVMSQQTRIEAMKPYYENWMQQFPTMEALAAADEDTVVKAWQGLGYYSRARNLRLGVKEVVEKYNGVVPRDRKAVESLKGVGNYTAGAILSLAYGLPEPAIDGNVLRVEHAVKACLLKLVDGDRGGDIVAQHDIELGIDELACLDLRQTRMCGQNFLRQSHSHNTLSFYFPWSRCPSYNLSVSHSLDSSPSRGALGIA